LEDIDKDLVRTAASWIIPGSRTKDGHGIVFAQIANLVPSDWGHKKIIDWIVWVYTKGILLEGMDWHRNGIVTLQDLAECGWKHFDTSLQQKMMGALNDNFPLRMKQMYLLNPPSFLKVLLKIAKLFMKKKMMDRIRVATLEDVREIVPENELCVQFGGSYKYEIGQYLKIMEEFSAVYEKDELEARRKRIESGEQKVEVENKKKTKKKKTKKKKSKKKDAETIYTNAKDDNTEEESLSSSSV